MCVCVRVEKLACLFIDTDFGCFSATRRHQSVVLRLKGFFTSERKGRIVTGPQGSSQNKQIYLAKRDLSCMRYCESVF